MPGFDEVIAGMYQGLGRTNREKAVAQADLLTAELTEELDQIGREAVGERGALSGELLDWCDCAGTFVKSFDQYLRWVWRSTQVPCTDGTLQLLLRHWHRQARSVRLSWTWCKVTLDRMSSVCGIYDHLGGGFARYSVDARWLVPHFEKMLYDNAQLAATYLEAYQATGNEDYARVVRETLDYILRDMTDEGGSFYSTEDADSEGIEGKFYTWKPAELKEVLGDEAAATFAQVYDVTVAGNFEHTNILNLPKTLSQQAKLLGMELEELKKQLAESRAKLFAVREERVHPHKDDKVIVAWNGLMIDAMARAGAVLGEPRYVEAATKAADFLLKELRREDGRLLHTWRHGKAKLDAYLDDYTYLANGLLSLYESTFESKYLDEAVALVGVVLEKFADKEGHGFYFTADDHEELIVRSKDYADNAVPSGNAMAALALVRLGKLTGKQEYLAAADSAMLAALEYMQKAPGATGQMLIAVDLQLGPTYEMVLAGNLAETASQQALKELYERFLPNKVLVMADAEGTTAGAVKDLVLGKSMLGGAPTLYVCEGFTCQAPAQGLEEITHSLDEMMPQGLFD